MKMTLLKTIFFAVNIFYCVNSFAAPSFIEEFPELKKYVYKEPASGFYFGFGVNPFSVLSNKIYFSASFFQLHWKKDIWDIEIINASLGLGMSAQSSANSRHFVFRASPKIAVMDFLSIGLLGGYEFVSFPDVSSRLIQGGFATPPEPFSSGGFTYGVIVTQTFQLTEQYQLRIAESVYRQNYSTQKAASNWDYFFVDPSIQNDPDHTLVKPSFVFMIEASLIF